MPNRVTAMLFRGKGWNRLLGPAIRSQLQQVDHRLHTECYSVDSAEGLVSHIQPSVLLIVGVIS